jgi:hypothetical protein
LLDALDLAGPATVRRHAGTLTLQFRVRDGPGDIAL